MEMEMGPEGEDTFHHRSLDIDVPQCALKRRFGISFCSSSSYFVEPRSERRGAVSFPSNDTNAIYIRMLGDVKMQTVPHGVPDTGQTLSESDKKMLEKLLAPEHKIKFRSRLLSMSKSHWQRHPEIKLSDEGRLLVDDFYASPARLSLNHIGEWDFNIFSLDSLSGGRALFQVAYHLFQNYHLIRTFQLEDLRLMHFLNLVEDNYHESNPYHNAIHAADVTQSMHCYLQEKKVFESTSDLDKMAALVAALTHDLDHPGVNNTFLIVTCNHLAALYQNSSVLENHHWRSAVGLLAESGLLSHFSSQQRQCFILQLKSLILATDITRQQEFLLKFNRYIESGEFQYGRNDEHRLFMLQIALKCADISNPCRPWEISQRWSWKICQEFFLQGDTERALNVAVTPLCDRLGNTVANIQHGFMQFVVNPLFKAWDRFNGTELSAKMLQHLAHNQAQWKAIMDKGGEGEETTSEPGDKLLEEDRQKSSGVLEDEDMDQASSVTDGPQDCPQPSDTKHLQADEDYDGKSEEDDVVENDVNLIYHYQTELDEADRVLCSMNSDGEQLVAFGGSNRRFSVPYVVRKDLSFYLGMRKDTCGLDNQFLRRQSLPTTAMYFHTNASSAAHNTSPRSLSMDALLARPKISNLSPSMEACFVGRTLDPDSFFPLQNQTLMLQGGTLTRFTSNPTSRRASYEPVLIDPNRIHSHLPTDLLLPQLKQYEISQQQISILGLASSWPTVAQRRTNNGSVTHSHLTGDDRTKPFVSADVDSLTGHEGISSGGLVLDPSHVQDGSETIQTQCLSLSDYPMAQVDDNLERPQ